MQAAAVLSEENYPSLYRKKSVVRGAIKAQMLVEMRKREENMIGSFVLMSACSPPPNPAR